MYPSDVCTGPTFVPVRRLKVRRLYCPTFGASDVCGSDVCTGTCWSEISILIWNRRIAHEEQASSTLASISLVRLPGPSGPHTKFLFPAHLLWILVSASFSSCNKGSSKISSPFQSKFPGTQLYTHKTWYPIPAFSTKPPDTQPMQS